MTMRPQWLAFGVAGCLVAATIFVTRTHVSPVVAKAAPPLAHANASFTSKPEKAESEYSAYVLQHAASKDAAIRDNVGAARMRLGYLAARKHDFKTARQTFLAAADTKGTGTMGEFGTVDDQAAYQAIVCLVADGKKDDARREFERYLRDRPLSALVNAAHRRLTLLNNGKSTPEWDALLQSALSKQEARIRFETSVCGPKCLERLTGKDYKTLAKLCGTTDAGTTIEGMRKGLKSLGFPSWAAKLNRTDLTKAKLPAILLGSDHYVLLEKIEDDSATVWDPMSKSSRSMKLPKLDDLDFSMTTILLARPEGL